ncbi:MAG TPA: hypothetical protein VFM97_04585 [Gammaproteobacteria bacterium]|nr:hypothetical protein [Gammaproteobacteria bacterium]
MPAIHEREKMQRMQVMMSLREREKAERIARSQGLSVSEVFRRAVRAYPLEPMVGDLTESEQSALGVVAEAWRDATREALKSVDAAISAIEQTNRRLDADIS